VTDDEKRRQKADLLLEYQEAQEHLSSLEEKARRNVDSLKMVIEWLEKIYDRTYNFDVMARLFRAGTIAHINEPRIIAAMNYEDLLALGRDAKAAMDKLRELSERKKALGVR
jgi:hypothetical protein